MEKQENKYVKRTRKDYSMSFKMSVIREYEEGYGQNLMTLTQGYNTPEFMHKQCTLKIITYKKADKKTVTVIKD